MDVRDARTVVAAIGAGLVLLAAMTESVHAQPQQFQFVVSAVDAEGRPVTDLRPEEIVMLEADMPNEVLRVEPYRVPVEVTIAVDNGPLSRDAIGHYRAGLRRLVDALPEDVAIALIVIAPQPRIIVPSTTDRGDVLRGVDRIVPQDESPRFTDAFVEFAGRLEAEFGRTQRFDSLPVLVMISTTAPEASSYEVPAIERAIRFLQVRKARTYIAMLSTRQDLEGLAAANTNRQAVISRPLVDATRGRYEALAISNRLATLLPEFGDEIAAMHERHTNQWLVTVQRQPGVAGPLRDPQFELTRPDLTGAVSVDGLP